MSPRPKRSRPERIPTLLAASGLLVASLTPLTSPAAVAQGSPAPASANGAAESALALIHYNRDLCDGIAGKVVAYWRGLTSSPEAQLKTVRHFVTSRELSSLAQGREVSDIINELLPRAETEAGSRISAALERLQKLEVELCDTVAYPTQSREAFEGDIGDLLDRIEREETGLGRMWAVPEDILEAALTPHLERILLAGVEAEGEYRDYLESLKPPPREPTVQELMEAWHQGYSRAVTPTKQALARYLKGRQTNDATLIRTACREISSVVIPLLRQEDVFIAPVGTVNRPLKNAFVEIKQLATHCVAGRSREVASHYAEMQKHLASAAQVLAEFSLRP